MGFYKYLKEIWKSPLKNNREEYKQLLQTWRKEGTIVRIERPSNIASARRLGYRAKNCFVLARVKIKKGGRKRPQLHSGRKPKKTGQVKYSPRKSLQLIAEERSSRKHPNLEVLNSYWVGDDGHYTWFEVILVDPYHPQVITDKNLQWLLSTNSRKRALRSLTSQGKKLHNRTK
ncbi:50S ribosomal protein L15e [archaeon CG10_big_fil_rev_8_21_14_0_10_43_11]|nr:MAG: 50S ribosomal protein L15e [archaeon CG10_big_fil_rev_8_21_14_0_10_43_11]